MSPARLLPRLALALLAVAGVAGAWFWLDARRWESGLAAARETQTKQRWGVARDRWRALAEIRPNSGEPLYELGVCELQLQRENEADAAWSRITPPDPFARLALARRGRLAMLAGRLRDAEDLLRQAIALPRTKDDEARWDLARALRLQGRFPEARQQFVEGLTEAPLPEPALRDLRRLDIEPFPIEGVRQYVERAERTAPADGRVKLARAYLDSRLNRHDDARRAIDDCLKARPDDPGIWWVALDIAKAADRPDEVAKAAAHLPPDPALALDLRAWLAARTRDPKAEREALTELLRLEPGRIPAVDRLAELALASGDRASAEKLRARKAELDAANDAYTRGLGTPEPPILAKLAADLGLRDEARWWAAIAASKRPEPETPPAPAAANLAALVPGLTDPKTRTPESADASERKLAFSDRAKESGLIFRQENGDPGRRLTPPVTSSGGVALLDYDNDGWLDVYAVQGGKFPPAPPSGKPRGPGEGDRLFRNKGDGTFEDVTEKAGLAAMHVGYGHGAAVGDVDNDGFPDLFVTRWRSYALYRNTGKGTFEDVTARYGLGGDRDWPTSAAFADLDADGDLDLYVCHYLRWDEADQRPCIDKDNPAVYHCSPRDFPALPDHAFRNDGGTFVDVTKQAGFTDRDGRGLGVLANDLDGDGKVDLYVANDTTANYLFRNLGNFRFEEVAAESGASANGNGGFQAGMGVAAGDLDGDGLPDLLVTNFYNESTSFFHNLGSGQFSDQTGPSGIGAASRYLLGFGVAALDVDNDGKLDIWTANGHVNDGRPQYPWMMPMQLLRNRGDGRFQDVSARSGPAFGPEFLGRALAAGDLDNDGRLDAVMVPQNAPLVLAHNESESGHFLTLRLEGRPPGSPRDAVGAVVTVKAGGRTVVAPRVGGSSYQSAPDPRVHVGLGDANMIESIDVRWPSGRVDRYPSLKADAGYLIREGEPSPRPLPGFPSR